MIKKEIKVKPLHAGSDRVSTTRRFAVCINNEGYPASLELHKVYEVIPDPFAEEHLMIRVIDESGEDYLFAANRFVPIRLPVAANKAFPANPQPTPATPPAARRAVRRTRGLKQTAP